MSIGAVVGLSVIGVLIFKAIKKSRNKKAIFTGKKALDEGRFLDSIQEFLRAESLWELSSSDHGKPAIWVKEYNVLSQIITLSSKAAEGLNEALDVSDLLNYIHAHREMVGDKNNFIPVIGVFKKELRQEDEIIRSKIELARSDFRKKLQKISGGIPANAPEPPPYIEQTPKPSNSIAMPPPPPPSSREKTDEIKTFPPPSPTANPPAQEESTHTEKSHVQAVEKDAEAPPPVESNPSSSEAPPEKTIAQTETVQNKTDIIIKANGLGDEILKGIHASKSYVGPAWLSLFLYYAGFFFIGLICNLVFLSKSKESMRITGSSPSGRGCLLFLLWVHLIIPIILIILIIVGTGLAFY